MTDYARFRGLLEYDEAASYPNPQEHEFSFSLTPTLKAIKSGLAAGANGAAASYDYSAMFTTVTLFAVHNYAASAAAVTLVYTDSAAGTPTVVLPANTSTIISPPHITPDMDPSAAFTLESADATQPVVLVTILGV